MKKIIATLSCLLVLSVAAIPAAAQTRNRYSSNRNVQSSSYGYNNYRDVSYRDNQYRNDRYSNSQYRNDRYSNYQYPTNSSRNYGYDNRTVWQKHRDKITTAGGAAVGAVVGGLIGGKKGAIIGAIAGGGGAALYTYKGRNR